MKLRNLFTKPAKSAAVQTAYKMNMPVGLSAVPLMPPDAMMLRSMRAAVPMIDAAINKIVRLTGGFSVECSSDEQSEALGAFLARVRVGASGEGIQAFLAAYLDQLLMYGTAVGEMLISTDGEDIAALYNADLNDLAFSGSTPFDVKVCVREAGGVKPAPYQQLIVHTALDPEPGSVTGRSLLGGLPFVTEILTKIYSCIGVNFERMGNLRYAVTYRPHGDSVDRINAKQRATQIAEQWSDAMKSKEVRDFVAVGDVDIKVIGAESQMLSTEVPVRQMLEQIVAKTGIPPFLLGLSWSSTERMSAQQADILTSELDYYRSLLTPVVRRICDMWLRLHGESDDVRVNWEPINLQDEISLAQARLYRAQAMQIEASLKGE